MLLLKQLYERVYVPDTVWKELVRPLNEVWTEIPEDVSEILNAYTEKWLTPKRLEQKYRKLSRELVTYGIHVSQADAIALAKQLEADFFLTNDEVARKVAIKHKVRTRWLTEVLLDALKVGLIKDQQNFDEMLDGLVSKGLWLRKPSFSKRKLRLEKLATLRHKFGYADMPLRHAYASGGANLNKMSRVRALRGTLFMQKEWRNLNLNKRSLG